MWHVDDGTLHAYLDARDRPEGAVTGEAAGAAHDWHAVETHVNECGECRGRLEEVRRLREQASTILAAAGPEQIRMPPFHEIRQRAAQGGAAGASRRLRRYRALAWAATIVMAAGVGWYAGFRFQGMAARDQAESALSRPQAEAVAPTREPQVQRQPTQVAEFPPPESLAQTRAERERPSAPADEAAQAQPPAAAHREEPAPPAGAVDLARAAESKARPRTDSLARARERADSAAGFRPGVVQVEEVVAAPAQHRAGAAAGWPSAPGGWTPVSADAARDALGQPLLQVEGMPVVSYAIGTAAGAPTVRVVQQVTPGVLLELLQQRDSAATDDARGRLLRRVPSDTVADSVAALTVVRGGVRVTLRAPVSLDSLQALAERIRN